MLKLNQTNQAYEVIALLDELNTLINTLAKLTDAGYYMDYIFNGWVGTQELLEEIGIDEDYLIETLNKFTKLRTVLYGDVINWEELVFKEMRRVAETERRRRKSEEEYLMRLEHKTRTLEKENFKLKKGGEDHDE